LDSHINFGRKPTSTSAQKSGEINGPLCCRYVSSPFFPSTTILHKNMGGSNVIPPSSSLNTSPNVPNTEARLMALPQSLKAAPYAGGVHDVKAEDLVLYYDIDVQGQVHSRYVLALSVGAAGSHVVLGVSISGTRQNSYGGAIPPAPRLAVTEREPFLRRLKGSDARVRMAAETVGLVPRVKLLYDTNDGYQARTCSLTTSWIFGVSTKA
jgi:hypothetical protein